MKIPFGKHKGKELTAIPKGYLRWLAAKCETTGDLRVALRDILGIDQVPYDDDEIAQAQYHLMEKMFKTQ